MGDRVCSCLVVKCFEMWYPTISEANGASEQIAVPNRFSVWVQHQDCQSSISVWAMLSDLWWESWSCPVQVQELESDDPSGSLLTQDVLWLYDTWINRVHGEFWLFEIRLKTERNACETLDLLDPGNTGSGPDPKDVWGNSAFSFHRTAFLPLLVRGHGLFGSVRVMQSGRLSNICRGDFAAFLAEKAMWLLVSRIYDLRSKSQVPHSDHQLKSISCHTQPPLALSSASETILLKAYM